MEKEEKILKAYRANGELICKICGKDYYSHPYDKDCLDWNGDPILNVLCNGDLVKL